jgi:G:T-mismatch repair DNA endonuclease (very short patch repair protein)
MAVSGIDIRAANLQLLLKATIIFEQKFRRNVDNDIKHQEELKSLGWNVVVLWECKLQKKSLTTQCLSYF